MSQHRFILGTAQFGLNYGINNEVGKLGRDAIFNLLDFAHEQGILQLDTAEGYGDAQTVIGDYIKYSGRTFQINTKFRVAESISIAKQLDQSLQQLSVGSIHVFFYHRASDVKSFPETLDELSMLKGKNLICKIGASIYTNTEFEDCINNDQIDVIQFPFNLLDNHSKRGNLITKARKCGKELQVRSVFLQGLFFKKPEKLPEKLQPLGKYLTQLRKLADGHQMSLHDLALGYAWSRSGSDHIIIGVDSKEQLQKNVTLNYATFDQHLTAAIDKIVVQQDSLLLPSNWS